MMRLSVAFTVACLIGGTAAADAQNLLPMTPNTPAGQAAASAAPAGPQATDASIKAARDMEDLLKIPDQTRAILQNMRNQLVNATMQASGKPIDEAAKIVDEVLMPDFNANIAQLTDALLLPWAANFSAADLKGLHDFYVTPLGQRLLKAIPAVQQQSVQAGSAWGQRNFQEAVKKHADELHARGLKF